MELEQFFPNFQVDPDDRNGQKPSAALNLTESSYANSMT
jgi:hypothetical protein